MFRQYFSVTIGMTVIGVAILFSMLLSSLLVNSAVNAADASQFNAGKIIDDDVFTNSSSMNVSQIQQFLEAKGINCRSGQQACLKDYYQDGKRASQILYELAQQYKINPQVLIVTLQKEQGLVTKTQPTTIDYRSATGYGCPDTAACNAEYYGFYNQVRWTATMFRAIMNNSSTWYAPYFVGSQKVYYNPNLSGCGSSTVNIQNRATAALYSYTPYQPNQASLGAGYGLGDDCSSYGNRNFYLYFTDWFGSTQGSLEVSNLYVTHDVQNQIFRGRPIEVSFSIKNITKYTYSFKYLGAAVRGPSDENLDPGWLSNISIAPGETYQYKKFINPSTEGAYKIYISSYAAQDSGWRECDLDRSQATCYTPKIIQNPVEVIGTPVVKRKSTGSVINELRQEQAFIASYSIRNTSALYSVKAGNLMLASRSSTGQNRDFVAMSSGTMTPGQTFEYSGQKTYNDSPGTSYNFYISTTKDNGKTYEERQFATTNSAVQQQRSIVIKPKVSLTQGPTVVGVGSVGAKSMITMRVKNFSDSPVDLGRIGVTVRGPQGQNADPSWQRVESLSAGVDDGIYTYQASFTPSVAGNWTISYMRTDANYTVWDANYLPLEDSAVKRSMTLPVKEATTLVQGPQLTEAKAYVKRNASVTLKVKTISDSPVDLGRIGVTVRGPQGQNADPSWQRVESLSAGVDDGIYTYQASFTPSVAGNWTISYMRTDANYTVWDANYLPLEDSAVKRSIVVNVLPQSTITSGVSVSGTTLGSREASFTITNHSSESVNLGKVGLAVRDPDGVNRDALWQDFIIPANSTKTHTVGVNFNKAGVWSFEIVSYKDGVWSSRAILLDDSSVKRLLLVNVS